MIPVSPAMQNLARRLLAFEAACAKPSDHYPDAGVLVCAKLRSPLSVLTGVAGFVSLLSRALALAKVQAPSLATVTVRPDGVLEGFDLVAPTGSSGAAGNGGAVLVAQLLGLLVTFIGEPLTLRLVHDTWPEVPVDARDLGTEETV